MVDFYTPLHSLEQSSLRSVWSLALCGLLLSRSLCDLNPAFSWKLFLASQLLAAASESENRILTFV